MKRPSSLLRSVLFLPALVLAGVLLGGSAAYGRPPAQEAKKLDGILVAAAGQEEEELWFGEEEEEKKEPLYPSRSLAPKPWKRKWMGRVNLGGYLEQELAVDTVQENSKEDMIDLRNKIFGYGSYQFSERTKLQLSLLALYQVLEGGDDRQYLSFNLYEGYLSFRFKKADLIAGQAIARWGVCDLLSPTDIVNPINYRSFIDPDSEDLRIPLPMIKTVFYLEPYEIEALYIPVFQSAIFQLAGSDLSLIKNTEQDPNIPPGIDPFLKRTIENFPAREVDYQEQKILMGDAGIKLSYREQKAKVELIYFTGRDDFPVILYTAAEDLTDPNASGDLRLEFDRFQMFGIAYLNHFHGVDVRAEFAYSPERSLTRGVDNSKPKDGVIDKTKREKRPWQAASIELDYLDPEGDFFIKLGAERITYLSAPENLVLSSADTIYFLALLRLYRMKGRLVPEWRIINLQSDSNQWFLSPRILYKFQGRFEITVGANLFSGSGTASQGTQEFAPITILAENNQLFASFRWSF